MFSKDTEVMLEYVTKSGKMDRAELVTIKDTKLTELMNDARKLAKMLFADKFRICVNNSRTIWHYVG